MPPTRTDSVAAVSVLLEVNPPALLIAEADGRIAGTPIAAWDGWRGNYRLAVLLSTDDAVGFWRAAGYPGTRGHAASSRHTAVKGR